MRRLKRIIYGWHKSDEKIYRTCYEQYGGSINIHPDVLNFIVTRTGKKISYFHYKKNGEIVGGYPVIDGKHVGINIWNMYPISYDDVFFPLAENSHVFFPERCNKISPALKRNIINTNYKIARKSTVCIVKENFSAKSEKNRRNEYRRFVDAGGVCVDQSNFSALELAKIYTKLFNARFIGKVRCHDLDKLVDIINDLRHLIFGNIFFINNIPCAMDLVFCAESKSMIYFDVPNGGVEPEYSYLSPGSLLMWKNIHLAKHHCAEKNKKMVFSIGAFEQQWAYKLRWANVKKTGKTIF